MDKKIEILAPAGAFPQLEAAVRCGADAVYFGASGFNARRNAANFGEEEFINAVKYCRQRGVKAYITLNTLIKDSELSDMEKTLRLIYEAGADGVIVQDFAVIDTVKKCCPSLPLHASTQMAVHNVSGALRLQNMGFSRVVLARELSVGEMKKIASALDIETEVFVHGAHCMSASGMCYISSVLGGRSGNRGLCAQPCRLNFKSGGREYALSLKDMCLAGMTEELKDAGVTSFKIEGRMKRPEYVAAAVTAYRKAVAGETPDTEALRNVFSRSGFTDGYARGKRDLSMFGFRTKEDVVKASAVLPSLAALYNKEKPLMGVSMEFTAEENRESSLVLSASDKSVRVTGPVPEKALNMELSPEMAEKSLCKLGSTFFYPENIKCRIDKGLMLRASDINSMRRAAAESLAEKLAEIKLTPFTEYRDNEAVENKREEPEIRLVFRKISQIPDNISFDKIMLPLEEIYKNINITEKYGEKLCAVMPSLIYPGDEKRAYEMLSELTHKGVKYALCENIGAIEIAEKAGASVLGGALLNIMNSRAASLYYETGVRDITLSAELSIKRIRDISFGGKIGMTVYGHMPLMHFRCCPMQGEKGCGKCTGESLITDRIGEKFPVLCNGRKYSVLHNCIPLYAGDRKLPPLSFYTLVFTTETSEEAENVIKLFKNKKALPGRKTAGLYDKEVL